MRCAASICQTGRALADNILLTPMLVQLSPAPGCQIVGTLSQIPVVMHALGLSV
jgi:hypothetical protein